MNWRNPITDLMIPEHRLGRLLAQGVALLALFWVWELMAHRFNRRWIFRCGWGSSAKRSANVG